MMRHDRRTHGSRHGWTPALPMVPLRRNRSYPRAVRMHPQRCRAHDRRQPHRQHRYPRMHLLYTPMAQARSRGGAARRQAGASLSSLVAMAMTMPQLSRRTVGVDTSSPTHSSPVTLEQSVRPTTQVSSLLSHRRLSTDTCRPVRPARPRPLLTLRRQHDGRREMAFQII